MCESPEKLQELFLQKREALLGKWVTLRLNDDSVIKLRIEGVGGRAVKLGKFMNYDKIFEEDDWWSILGGGAMIVLLVFIVCLPLICTIILGTYLATSLGLTGVVWWSFVILFLIVLMSLITFLGRAK